MIEKTEKRKGTRRGWNPERSVDVRYRRSERKDMGSGRWSLEGKRVSSAVERRYNNPII